MRKQAETLTLTRRSDGRFCKKIGGTIHYFGRDEEKARQALLDFYQLKGVSSPSERPDRTTVQGAGEAFLARQQQRVDDGDLSKGTFDDYDVAISEFAGHVGPDVRVSDLRADQFGAFRAHLAKRLGTGALDRNIQAVRTMFKWAYDNRVIDAVPRYGDRFHKSKASDRGQEQAVKIEKHGHRVFSTNELRAILKHEKCSGDLRTFILLGLNAGFYSKDCSDLDWSEIRIEGRDMIVDRYRVKNSRPQRFICWPEVRAAIEAKRAKKSGRVFLTVFDNPWNEGTKDAIGQQFDALLESADVKRKGLGFGALRHTHISAVGALGDLNAARRVRGHQIREIERHYDTPSIKRLRAVTSLARQALLLKVVPPSTAWLSKKPSPR